MYSQRCESCDSDNLHRFGGELAIHFSGPQNIDRPAVVLFPELVVCLACGNSQFTIPETELRSLAANAAPARG